MWKWAAGFLYLLILSVMDIREKKVSTAVLAVGLSAAGAYWVCKMAAAGENWPEILKRGLLGIVPGAILLATAGFTKKAGWGDGITLISLGMLFGYLVGMELLCISLFFLSVCSAVLMLCRKIRGNTRMPYLPFLAAAYVCIYITGKG